MLFFDNICIRAGKSPVQLRYHRLASVYQGKAFVLFKASLYLWESSQNYLMYPKFRRASAKQPRISDIIKCVGEMVLSLKHPHSWL